MRDLPLSRTFFSFNEIVSYLDESRPLQPCRRRRELPLLLLRVCLLNPECQQWFSDVFEKLLKCFNPNSS
jgi:hypothetical protein